MAVNAFITFFDKADGESLQKGKEKWIEIQGWDWEIEAETSWTKGGGASVGKPNPGKMNYASAGVGSATHLAMAYFCGLANIDMVHVPLKATGEAINEVISGRAQAVIAASIGALAFAKDSRLRLLGVTSPKRSKYLPDLPPLADSGLPGYQFDSWFGFVGPAATPPAQADRINAAVGKLLKDPAILERLDKQGIEPTAMSNADFGKLLAADYQRMAAVVKAAGTKLD